MKILFINFFLIFEIIFAKYISKSIEMERNTKQKLILKNLKSKDYNTVLEAIKDARKDGDVNILKQILLILDETSNTQIKEEIIKLIKDLRFSNGVPYIIKYISESRNETNRYEIISACWQSNLDFSKHLDIFNKIVIADEYKVAIEAFTVIEQAIERSKPEKKLIDESMNYLKNSISKCDEDKQALIMELIKTYEKAYAR
ncbi:MAG: hypothetical protein Kow0068_15940 [Marinilabiliales bacterium]